MMLMGIAWGNMQKYLYGDSDSGCVFLFGFNPSVGRGAGSQAPVATVIIKILVLTDLIDIIFLSQLEKPQHKTLTLTT
jgi:hypothetical protein